MGFRVWGLGFRVEPHLYERLGCGGPADVSYEEEDASTKRTFPNVLVAEGLPPTNRTLRRSFCIRYQQGGGYMCHMRRRKHLPSVPYAEASVLGFSISGLGLKNGCRTMAGVSAIPYYIYFISDEVLPPPDEVLPRFNFCFFHVKILCRVSRG